MLRFDIRSTRYRLTRTLGVAMLAGVVSLGLIACGGDDKDDATPTATAAVSTATSAAATSTSSSSTTVTTTRTAGTPTAAATTSGTTTAGSNTADGLKVAKAALIAASDLPGQGWSQTGEDDYESSIFDTEDPSDFGTSPGCQAAGQKVTDTVKAHEADITGRAARDFDQTAGAAFFGSNATVNITVYKNQNAADDIVKTAKSVFESTTFLDCFKEIFTEDATDLSGGDVKIAAVAPGTKAPANGVNQAFTLTLGSAGITFDLRIELYVWRDKEALAVVSVLGTKDAITADLVAAAVNKTQTKLAAAH